MITVHCARCTKELSAPGGLLFSPPESDQVYKHHLCVACYDDVGFEIDKHREQVATHPDCVRSVGAV